MSKIIGVHRNNGEDREKDDFYATHPTAVAPLLNFLGWSSGGKLILENSCGQGHLSKALELAGHKVISIDLIDRGFGVHGVDFLQPTIFDSFDYDAVVMNPPYKYALEFVKKSLTIAPVVCAFLRLAFLEGGDKSGRAEFFQQFPPRYVAVFSDRVKSAKHGKFKEYKGGTVAYAWFIWQRGYIGAPEIKWLRIKSR